MLSEERFLLNRFFALVAYFPTGTRRRRRRRVLRAFPAGTISSESEQHQFLLVLEDSLRERMLMLYEIADSGYLQR